MFSSQIPMILSLAILLNLFSIAWGIDCYVCTSATNSYCGEDPNGAALILAGYVSSGCSSCVKEFTALGTIWSTVVRRCGTWLDVYDSCTNIAGYGSCACTTSYCNHGNNFSYCFTLILMLVAFSRIVKQII